MFIDYFKDELIKMRLPIKRETVKKFPFLLYLAAATTLIAGILHIIKVIDTTNSGEAIGNADILFFVGGIAYVFWMFRFLDSGVKRGIL
jgi:hypothetical protein